MTIDELIERLEKRDGHWLAPQPRYSVRIGGKQDPKMLARTILYDHFRGPRKHKTLHITCGEPCCCNPDHMEEVVPAGRAEYALRSRIKRGMKVGQPGRPRKREKRVYIEPKASKVFPGSPEFVMLQELAIQCGFQPVRGILGIRLRKVA